MIEVVPREHPEADNVKIRDSVQVVVKFFYFINLAVLLLYSSILLIVEKKIQKNSISFVLILVYGFMALWIFLFDLVFVVNSVLSSAPQKIALCHLVQQIRCEDSDHDFSYFLFGCLHPRQLLRASIRLRFHDIPDDHIAVDGDL